MTRLSSQICNLGRFKLPCSKLLNAHLFFLILLKNKKRAKNFAQKYLFSKKLKLHFFLFVQNLGFYCIYASLVELKKNYASKSSDMDMANLMIKKTLISI